MTKVFSILKSYDLFFITNSLLYDILYESNSLAKFKFGDFEWEINNPLYANMEQAKQNLDEAANKAQNINIDFNIQNKYNEELNTIMKKKGGKNV